MKTKIIATLGLKTCSKEIIKKMILAWASIFRSNLSHGSLNWHKEALLNAKKAWEELWVKVKTMLDTKGPEIRTEEMDWEMKLKKWKTLIFVCDKKLFLKKDEIYISHEKLYQNMNLKKWRLISLDSWKINLKITKIEGKKIFCEIWNDWILSGKRHVNIPWLRINLPILRDIDKRWIEMWKEIWVDFLAASFVRDLKDVKDLKQFIWNKKMKLISKIEHFEALNHIDEIIKNSDEIMVARWDLWIEMPYYEVPLLEEMLIKKAKKAKKPVIVATQMLISMTKNVLPTRAEAMDVTIAVQLWADKIMLSDETASWIYPIKAIETMKEIAEYVEKNWARLEL